MPVNVAETMKDLPAEMVETAQRIWFAGLGALAMAQAEGNKFFSMLVEKGSEMERDGFSPSTLMKGATSSAEDAWKKLQTAIDAQVSAALHRLGVPTKDELDMLTARMEQLTASIEALKARK